MKVIYHIHDQCCGHAGNTLESIIQTSLAQGYKELFMTEHCPLDNNNVIFRPSRADIDDLRNRINIANKKYAGKLLIHFGFEAEYSKWNTSYFDNFVNDPQCDYLIFGNHYLGDM
jgi:histidinol-phosphatase (PHP family)